MVPVKTRATRSGGTFMQMRVIPQLLASVQSTPDERVASVFSSCISSGRGSGHDVYYTSGPLVEHVAKRVPESTALRDAAACMVLAWQNLRRGVHPTNFIDLASYGEALRSLQRALDDPRQQLSVHVLAATSLLYGVEVPNHEGARECQTDARRIRTM